MYVYAAGQPFRVDEDPAEVLDRIEIALPRFLEESLAASGVTHSDAARAAGIARQTFEKLFERGGRTRKPLHASLLYVLPMPARVRVLADMLGKTHAIVELPGTSTDERSLPWFSKAVRDVNEAVLSALDAAADGHITRGEGAELEALCDHAISLLLAIREIARQARREGVIGLKAVGGKR